MFCKRTIFCVSYMRIEVLMSLIIVNVKVWTVTVTSPLVHVKTTAIFCRSCYWWQWNKHRRGSSELENSDDKTSDQWCKTDIKPSNEPFLGTTGLNIVIDNPESVAEFMSSVIGDELIQLLTEQSDLYHGQNAEKWKVSPKRLKWSNITPEEMRKFLWPIILMGQVKKANITDYWSTESTISTPIFLTL